jgi:hypothetical protein
VGVKPTKEVRRIYCVIGQLLTTLPWAIKGTGNRRKRGRRFWEGGLLLKYVQGISSFRKGWTQEAASVPRDARVLPADLHLAANGDRWRRDTGRSQLVV